MDGDFLVMVKQITQRTYIVDILKFSEENVYHFKQISKIEFPNHNTEVDEMYLDVRTGRLFMYDFQNTTLIGFDFDGRHIFSRNFLEQYGEQIIHIHKSVFLLAWGHTLNDVGQNLELFTFLK